MTKKLDPIEKNLNKIRLKIYHETKNMMSKEFCAYFNEGAKEFLRRYGYRHKRDGTIEKIKKNRQPTAISSAPAASKPTTKTAPAKKPKPAALKPAPKAVPEAATKPAPPKAKTPKPAKKVKK